MSDSQIIIILVLWAFIGGLVGALIGQWKGRVMGGFWLGFFLGFIGWVLVALGPDFRRKAPQAGKGIDPDLEAYLSAQNSVPDNAPTGDSQGDPQRHTAAYLRRTATELLKIADQLDPS